MRKYKYNIFILLAVPFVTNCNPGTPSKKDENASPRSTPSSKVKNPTGDEERDQTKPLQPTPQITQHQPSAQPTAQPPKPAAPIDLSVQKIRDQQAKLTMGQTIDEFNQLKTHPAQYTRKTLDNFVEALMWKHVQEIGKGNIDLDKATFKVSGDSIEIEEAPNMWKKIDTDIEDKRALFKWLLDRNIGIQQHLFESGMQNVGRINLIEQAVAWDDRDYVRNYFSGGVIGKDGQLNSLDSTPLAFARSVPMAQILLDEGAKADARVRKLVAFKTVLAYLKATNAPQAVIDLVENY